MERRSRRSEDPYSALCFQLERCCAQGNLDTVVLASRNGLLVAGAGEPKLCEALSAVAPLLDEPHFDGRLPEVLRGQRIRVRPLSVDGETLFVASATLAKRAKQGSDRWLQRSAVGVQRILRAA